VRPKKKVLTQIWGISSEKYWKFGKILGKIRKNTKNLETYFEKFGKIPKNSKKNTEKFGKIEKIQTNTEKFGKIPKKSEK